MKFAPIVLAAALGVAAHPSGYAHLHAQRGLEFVKAGKPAPPAPPAPKTSAAPAAAPSPSPAAPAAAAAAVNNAVQSTVNTVTNAVGEGLSTFGPFCTGNNKRATIAQIAYKGNTGTASSPGCNQMLVKSNIVDQYPYAIAFKNAGGDSTCACWNKIGPDGGINGFFSNNQAINFKLPAGGVQNVVFDKNTQGGCACSVGGSVALTSFGQFASTWVEFDFGNTSNNGWVGADASCLVSAKYNLNIPGMNVCFQGQCSTIFPGGTGKNAYLAGMEDADGVGLNLNNDKVHLDVTVNYSG